MAAGGGGGGGTGNGETETPSTPPTAEESFETAVAAKLADAGIPKEQVDFLPNTNTVNVKLTDSELLAKNGTGLVTAFVGVAGVEKVTAGGYEFTSVTPLR